jgi:hypothetical protein
VQLHCQHSAIQSYEVSLNISLTEAIFAGLFFAKNKSAKISQGCGEDSAPIECTSVLI